MNLRERLAQYKKKILIFGIPITILISLCIAFGIYCGYYAIGNKALPGVKIGNIKVRGKTETQLIKQLEKADKNIRITFSNGNQKTYSLSDLGYKLNAKATAKEVIKYNKSFKNYFRALFQNYTVIPVFSIDGEKLINISNELSKTYHKSVPAVEPTTEFNKSDNIFKSVPGKTGIGAQPTSLIAAAKKAIYNQKNLKATVKYGKIQPVSTDADANVLTKEANILLNLQVKINATVNNQNKEFTVDKATLASWINLPLASSKTKPTFDLKKSHDWLENAKNQITISPIEGYRYIAPSGKVLRVINDPKDGIAVSNFDDVNTALGNSLKIKNSYTGTLETKVAKASWKNKTVDPGAEWLAYAAAPGEKWIDVNLSSHTITAYIGAKKQRGPESVYTGDTGHGHATIVGTYTIHAKLKSQTMRGADYVVPNVPNVMYFEGDYAIHGAPWTDELYKENNGQGWGLSHGCVNIPTREGLDAWYYNWAPIGTVVRTHY